MSLRALTSHSTLSWRRAADDGRAAGLCNSVRRVIIRNEERDISRLLISELPTLFLRRFIHVSWRTEITISCRAVDGPR